MLFCVYPLRLLCSSIALLCPARQRGQEGLGSREHFLSLGETYQEKCVSVSAQALTTYTLLGILFWHVSFFCAHSSVYNAYMCPALVMRCFYRQGGYPVNRYVLLSRLQDIRGIGQRRNVEVAPSLLSETRTKDLVKYRLRSGGYPL